MSDLVVAYTDGSGSVRGRRGGIGVVILAERERVEVSVGIGEATNNRAELAALRSALLRTHNAPRVAIYSDSEWAIGAVSRDWQIRANVDLVAAVRAILSRRRREGHEIDLHHVEGHCGIPGNEQADQLAKDGRVQQWRRVVRYEDGGAFPRAPSPLSAMRLREALRAAACDRVIATEGM